MKKEENAEELLAGVNDEKIKEIIDTIDSNTPKKKSVYDCFAKQIAYAKERVKLDSETEEAISGFGKTIEMDVPFVLDKKFHDKQVVRILSGFRVQHSKKKGPYFGGARLYPKLNLDEAKALAALTTLKTSLLELPLGGSAGGVSVNPKLLSKEELTRVSHGYVRKVARFIGPNNDLLITDRGVDGKVIGWMAEEYEKLTKNPDTKNGFLGRLLYGKTEPVSLGAITVLQEFLKKQEVEQYPGIKEHEDIVQPKTTELKIAIQGFGFVASNLAALLHQAGHKIIAVTDEHGGTASIKGLDPRDVLHWKRTHGTVKSMPKGISITNDQLLKMKADLLILAATENQITEENAMLVNAPIILEIANFAVTPEADKILQASGKTLIPDIVSNTGSIISSYLELMQNQGGKKEDAEEKVKEGISRVFNKVYSFAKANRTTMRDAAYILALNNFMEK